MLVDTTGWRAASGDYALTEDEVHVWRATLDGTADMLELRGVLSSDEREKAASFHFEVDRSRFVLGRGMLRFVLAQCLGTRAEEFRFEYGRFGKPVLAPSFLKRVLQFNLSHSGDLVLLAVAVDRAVGIDVERVRTDISVVNIAEHYFSMAERTAFVALPESVQPAAFYACWTRKEAYTKATGDGLSLPLHQFDVSLRPGEPARLIATRPDPGEAQRWTLLELDAGTSYKAAVAVEGQGFQLKAWNWPHDRGSALRSGCELLRRAAGWNPRKRGRDSTR